MKLRDIAAALILIGALVAACQPAGGGTESTAPSDASSSEGANPSATPYTVPGY